MAGFEPAFSRVQGERLTNLPTSSHPTVIRYSWENGQPYKCVSDVVREEGVEPSNASVMSAPAYRWPILDQQVR